MEHINWYPGHMKKTRELIQQNLKLVDVVIEIIDARIPVSSRNPVIDEIVGDKPRIVLLNKSDLADPLENEKWIKRITEEGQKCLEMNAMSGQGTKKLFSLLSSMEKTMDRGNKTGRPLRMMIVGIPNVGKSSLINRMTGRKAARTGDRPGVTTGKQWLTLQGGMQLLDTPGILWPKFEDQETGRKLAWCGSIKDEILDIPELAMLLIGRLAEDWPGLLMERYKLDSIAETALENMENIAAKRGFLLPGKRIDYDRTARTVLDEFRGGKIGRITLEPAGPVFRTQKEQNSGKE